METKTCGNCAHHDEPAGNGPLVKCSADITVYGWKDVRDNAERCPFWKAKWPEKHLVMHKVVATSYGKDWRNPFDVRIYCTDGHVYQALKDRVMQARCAGWDQSWHEYTEMDVLYTENVWTGKGLPVVVTDRQLLR